MDVGRLNKRITFVQMTDKENSLGQLVKVQEPVKTVWATVSSTKGKEQQEANKIRPELNYNCIPCRFHRSALRLGKLSRATRFCISDMCMSAHRQAQDSHKHPFPLRDRGKQRACRQHTDRVPNRSAQRTEHPLRDARLHCPHSSFPPCI